MICDICPNTKFILYVNECFGSVRKSGRQPETETKNMKKEMEKLKAKRNDFRNKLEKARRENRHASDEEVRQWQSCLESMEGEVAAIFEDFIRINFRDNIKLGLWGVMGDNSFDTAGLRISKFTTITVYSRAVVHSLEVSYVADRKNVETARLGAEGGQVHRPFDLRENEYIEKISGFIVEHEGDSCISQLKFKTNLGNISKTFGAKEGGKEFTVQIANGQIVGLFGYYSRFLKAIGVYVAPTN